MRKLFSRLLLGFIALALTGFVWLAITIIWQEPVTAIQHNHLQGDLRAQLDVKVVKASSKHVPVLPEGHAVGSLKGPHINTLVAFGRSPDTLKKAPGMWNSRPGHRGTVVISGHRTTYGAPFRDIDELERQDVLRLETPYGVWRYKVYEIAIVNPDDLSVVRDRPDEETLVLTACHPVYSAAQRYIVTARLLT